MSVIHTNTLKSLCAKRGLSYEAVTGRGRGFAMDQARRELIQEMRLIYPDASVTTLARSFKRDHSTISVALRGGKKAVNSSGSNS